MRDKLKRYLTHPWQMTMVEYMMNMSVILLWIIGALAIMGGFANWADRTSSTTDHDVVIIIGIGVVYLATYLMTKVLRRNELGKVADAIWALFIVSTVILVIRSIV